MQISEQEADSGSESYIPPPPTVTLCDVGQVRLDLDFQVNGATGIDH